MRTAEYTVGEMKHILENLAGMYDLVRVVDPTECRVLELHGDGRISTSERCYNVWRSEQRCINCSSADACRTGCHREKSEHFQDSVFHIQSNPICLKLPDGGRYEAVLELVSIQKDVEERQAVHINDREAEDENYAAIRYHAQHDSLTKCLKAEVFFEQARERLLQQSDMTWLMITGDIMGFRMVNNLFGELKGNEVLVRTAELLQEITREAGGLCGRVSGDVFAMLLPKSTYRESALREAAGVLAEHMSSGVFTLRIHFGVYEIDGSGIPISVMCDRANMALRTIKSDAREIVAWFDEEMMRRSLFEQQVISGFDEALRQGQFQMYLQPLTGADGKPFGAEALVRWVRPDGTIILPGAFIETLERAGLIQELDAYIWELAVRQLGQWKNTDRKDLTISVNISAKDFYNADICGILTGLIEKYDVDSSRLRLEITETAMVEDPEKCEEVLSRLRQAGFLIEIDDFGKGYSSLSLLKNIHADLLKIDMDFLRETGSRKRSRIILESVIDMANSLGMEVITEGVETEKQLRSLSEMGCRCFQGFYFSRPIPVEEFELRYSG